MDADYLKSTLGDLLSEGLAATVLKNPKDKIEYLAEWLLQSVAEKQRADGIRIAREQLLARDSEIAVAEKQEEEKEAAAQVSQATTSAEREKQFQAVLANAESFDTLLPVFLQFLRDLTGASSAYFGQLETNKETESSHLRYLAATPENEWLLDKRLEGRKGKNTFDIFVPDEEEPEEEDENGNPIPRAVKPPKSVFVPNVLLGPKSQNMFFFKQPQLGSYTAVRIAFPQSVSDEVLDEALERESEILALKKEADEAREQAEKEAREEAAREAREAREEAAREAGEELSEEEENEDDEDDDDASSSSSRAARRRKKAAGADGEEEKEETEEEEEARQAKEDAARAIEEEEFMLTQLQRQPIEYALCLDTLGQNRRFSDEQLATITRYATLLQSKLQALDRASFTHQRKRRAALLEFNREVAELNEQGTLKTEEEKAEELERCSDELEAMGKPMTEEDVVFKYRTELILGSLKQQIAEWAGQDVLRGSLAVLQAVFFLLGYPKKQVVDSAEQPEWRRMRKLLDGEQGDLFFAALRDYEPRATFFEDVRDKTPEKLYTESVAVGKIVEPLEYEDVKARNYALSELLLWVREALAVKRRAKLERAKAAKKKQREEERKAEEKRLEEERLAEEAERRANGEEEEENKDEEEEEEED